MTALTVKQFIEIMNKPEYLDKELYLCYDNGCLLPVEKIENHKNDYVVVTGNGHQSNHWIDPQNGYTRIYDSEDPNLELKAYCGWTTKKVYESERERSKEYGSFNYYAKNIEDAKKQVYEANEYRYRYSVIPIEFSIDDVEVVELK